MKRKNPAYTKADLRDAILACGQDGGWLDGAGQPVTPAIER